MSGDEWTVTGKLGKTGRTPFSDLETLARTGRTQVLIRKTGERLSSDFPRGVKMML